MSEIKLISPLLDGFAMGNPMSEHDGVRCCPAIKEKTEEKYIVKIISVPATQAQLDALLIAGAYKDPADAMEYFRQVGEGILEEAELLKTLSKLDGFLPYEGWQMEPITRRRLGYLVYLVGSYKRSLEKHMKDHPVTRLEALTLALDLCAALTVCREAGAIYVALKPGNVFVSEKKEYRIGDLGFIRLDALRYAALPEKYLSPYTPPELFDPMASMNLTVDTYGLGMILYQLYNDGQLPFKGKMPPQDALPSPVNADYEMAEIIMKAIDPDPENRWTDPKDMGKALAEYMQRNDISDVPITPHTPLDVKPEDIVVLKEVLEEPVPAAAEEASPEIAEEPVPQEEVSPKAEEDSLEPVVPEETAEEVSPVPEEIPPEEPVPEAEVNAQEEPVEESLPEPEAPVSEPQDELSRLIDQADDLMAHTPDVLEPKPVQEDPFAFVRDDDTLTVEEPAMEPLNPSEPQPEKRERKQNKHFADPKYRQRKKRIGGFLATTALLALLGAGSYWYYQTQYLLQITDLILQAGQNQITVTIDSDAEDASWIVKCMGADGKTTTQGISQSEAIFGGLEPNTTYTIQVEADGFHKLVGVTSERITTEPTTKILSFTSLAGQEDGSVVLNFEMEGQEPNDWTVFYSAEGEEEQRSTFDGHSTVVNGLTLGKVYCFRLDTGEGIALGGQTTLEYLVSPLILAEDLTLTTNGGQEVTASWKVPGDVVVNHWQVRCYNNYGYEETMTVTEQSATFSQIDPTVTHTIEVTAEGMTRPAKTVISANPVTLTSLNVDDSQQNVLNLSWEHSGTQPGSGWLLTYHLAGGGRNVVECKEASAQIAPKIPGAVYHISIQAANGTTVLNGVQEYTVPQAVPFEGQGLTQDRIAANLLKTPDEKDWLAEKQEESVFTDTFAAGTPISMILQAEGTFFRHGVETEILYVIRDSYGNILPEHIARKELYWHELWNKGNVQYAELDLPAAPTWSGSYVLEVYFNGMTAAEIPFTIQ